MSKKRSYVLVLFFLMLFSVSFSHNVFAYGPDYPVAEKPSLTARVLSGVENIASIYSGTVKNQKAAFISSLRDTVLDFLGFTNEEPSPLPTTPTTPTAPANPANPDNSTKTFPNYVTNNYITNTYPSTIIKGGGGSTSGLARSVSRTNSTQDDTLTSLQNQIDGLPLGDIFSTSTTRGVLSSSATGLTYATSTGIFSLSSGYEIPLSASTTAWNTFYTTPSSRITAGTNLSWSSNTLDISTTPTFASTTLSNFTAGSIPFFGTGGSLNQNNSKLFWDNTNARLGIGTTTPVGTLSIIPTSNTSAALYIKGLTSQSGNVIDYRNSVNTSLLNFDPSVNGNAGMMTLNYLKAEGGAYISDIGAHNAANNLTIGPTDTNGYSLIFRTNNAEKARFTSSGNFGIGTTTPTAKLQVVSTTEQQRIGFNSTNYFTTTVGATGSAIFDAVGSGASFSFSDKTTVTDGSRTVVLAGSTYAIDATAPNNGTVARFSTAYGVQPMVAVLGDPSRGAGVFTDDGGNEVDIATGFNAISAVGDISTTGDVCSTNYCLEALGASDSRLKKNIETFDDGDVTMLDKVLSLNPVSYEWNDTYNESYRPQSDPVQLGFIAQDIKEIFPELVSENKDGYMIVKYNQLTAVIVRAIQELNTKVDNLVASLADKVVTMKEAIVGKLRIEGDVCVDDVCVTKEQFKSLLQNAGGTNPPEEPEDEGEDDVVVDPVIDPAVDPAVDPVIDDVTEDEEDDAVVPPEPEAEIEPIIEPEAEPVAEPVSNEAPTPDEISL